MVPNGILQPEEGGGLKQLLLARRIPGLRALEAPGYPWMQEEAEDFPKNPRGDDLCVPPASLDSSGDASHLTVKREELRH